MSPAPDPSLRLKSGYGRDDAFQPGPNRRIHLIIHNAGVIPKPRAFTSGARDPARSLFEAITHRMIYILLL